MASTVKKNKGGRPKINEYHKSYAYINKSGKTVHVKAHKERYVIHTHILDR